MSHTAQSAITVIGIDPTESSVRLGPALKVGRFARSYLHRQASLTPSFLQGVGQRGRERKGGCKILTS